MTDTYRMVFVVEDLPGDRHEAVARGVAGELESVSIHPDGRTLRLTGRYESYCDIPPDIIADHVAREIWAAAGGYRPVTFRATRETVEPDEEVEYTEELYAEMMEDWEEELTGRCGTPHEQDRDVERSGCGGQEVGCDGAGHDPAISARTGELSAIAARGPCEDRARPTSESGPSQAETSPRSLWETLGGLPRYDFSDPIVAEIDPRRLDDEWEGRRLHGTIRLFGAPHHLTLLRVRHEPGRGLVPEDPSFAGEYEALQSLYDGSYWTCEVPGLAGEYVAFVVPYA